MCYYTFMSLNTQYFFYYDLFLLVLAGLILFLAYRKGFLRQLLDVASLLVILWLAVYGASFLAENYPLLSTQDNFVLQQGMDVVNSILWFILITMGLRLLYWILTASFSPRKKGIFSTLNRLAGLGLGVVKVLFLGLIISMLLRLPLIQYGDVYLENSILRQLDPISNRLIAYWEEDIDASR